MGGTGSPPEIALSAAWHEQRFNLPLQTTDGQVVEIIHRGVWSNGFGPDFRDALLLFDGRELRGGSVEIHRRTSGWNAHGHHTDPRYDDVILHVVLTHDGAETRRHDGRLVAVVQLDGLVALPVEPSFTTADWSRFGGASCASDLASARPDLIRVALHRLGDLRLAAKAARIEAQLTGTPPGDVLLREIWDGLGYSANRTPMRELAARLPLAVVEATLATARPTDHLDLARGLLFGVAGFIPLSPADAAFAHLDPTEVESLESAWHAHGAPWQEHTQPPTAWTRARARPANHPAARLAAAAALLVAFPDGLVAGLLGLLRSGADPIDGLRRATATHAHPGIGQDRAAAIIANALLPFALALSEHTGDPSLAEAAASAWERLPAAEPNELTRRALRQVAGDARLKNLGARGQQGLLHLDAALCSPRRCFECPIAHAVLSQGAERAEGAE